MSFDRWRATGREAAVIGLGKSGRAAALLLKREGVPVYVSDLSSAPYGGPGAEAELRAAGIDVQLGGHDLARITRAGICVVSPGVPPAAPPIKAAIDAGVPLVSELDVGYAGLPATKFAVITGTNGKTTTTALTGHLMQAAGIHALTAGNIGMPLAQVALDGNPPAWIALEMSSFQLADTRDLVPAIGATTNLAPDHLDRYPDLESYYRDKDQIYLHACDTSIWVLNGDDAEVNRRAEGKAGTKLQFRIGADADAWYDRERRELVLDRKALLARDELQLFGDHNVANALCAALIASRAGAGREAIAEGLRTFRALKHRMEPVREVGGVLYINDSKATNVSSTKVAVEALERPFVLLLGGRHKGEAYTALAEASGGRCRAVIAFGESQELIEHDLGGRLKVIPGGRDFAKVMQAARAAADPGDAVLLSPACSSYDMFKNYEDRGAQFRAAVEAL
jgi:UDP-N-acetylmuramoylalanine--D-glutamate ligase